jgi:small-conductance mechanosensitive channel
MRKTILINLLILLLVNFVSLSQTYLDSIPPDTDGTLIEKIEEKTEIVKKTSTKDIKTTDSIQTIIKEETGFDSVEDDFKFEKIVFSILIIVAGFYLLKIITKILQHIAGRRIRHGTSLKRTISILRLAGWSLIAYIVIAVVIQPPFEIIIVILATIGIAVGLASQDLLKNVFGGIMILFDQPYKVGDKIQVGENYGQVLTIGLRSTKIVNDNDAVVCIPNSLIMTQFVSNSNLGEPHCQVFTEVYLPIDINTVLVRDIALEVARVSKYVYLKKPISVLFFNEVKEKRSLLKMRLKAYVLDIKHEFAFKSEMTELIIRELISEGVLKKEDVS